MGRDFCQVLISVENKGDADRLMDKLLKARLIAGALISAGTSRKWLKGKIIDSEHYGITAFTKAENREKIIELAEKLCSGMCPIVAFSTIDGNETFLKWILSEANPSRLTLTFLEKVIERRA